MKKLLLTRSPLREQKSRSNQPRSDRGFGLIEVVVAIALIAGAYIGMLEAYQRLRLHSLQIEAQRTELNKAQDQHERGAL